jgi:hypothetical protein
MLYASLVVNQTFFKSFFEISPELFSCISMATFCQVGNALSTMFKLSFLDAPGWDLGIIRETHNMSTVLAHLIHRFEEAGHFIDARNERNGNDALTRCACKLKKLKAWYDAKIAADIARSSQQIAQAAVEPVGMESMEFENWFGNLNGCYWEDMIENWEGMMS